MPLTPTAAGCPATRSPLVSVARLAHHSSTSSSAQPGWSEWSVTGRWASATNPRSVSSITALVAVVPMSIPSSKVNETHHCDMGSRRRGAGGTTGAMSAGQRDRLVGETKPCHLLGARPPAVRSDAVVKSLDTNPRQGRTGRAPRIPIGWVLVAARTPVRRWSATRCR